MLPWAIAVTRSTGNARSIALLNASLGWTVVGWIVALVMACRRPESRFVELIRPVRPVPDSARVGAVDRRPASGQAPAGVPSAGRPGSAPPTYGSVPQHSGFVPRPARVTERRGSMTPDSPLARGHLDRDDGECDKPPLRNLHPAGGPEHYRQASARSTGS
jgi:hypothetical protein